MTKSSPEAGYLELVRRWLRSFGPGTEDDLVWWLGATKAAVRRALGELGAVEVALSDGTGYLLPDDLDDAPEPEPWAALLPVLDPATMGWKQRDFYLDPEDRPFLYRHQRQRRHHRLVVRTHRRLLGPGPRRCRAGRASG